MRKFGTIAVSLVVLLVWLTPVFAAAQQEQGEKFRHLMEHTTPAQRARFEDRWMEKNLQLSHDQAAKVEEINLSAAEQTQSIYDSQQGKLRKGREIKRVQEEKERQLERVLTEEQFAKYQAKKEEMRQKMHEMR